MMSILAIGVGWAETATLPNTQALTTDYAYVGNDTHIRIKTSSANGYTNPLRFYANVTMTITADDGYVLKSVTYESSSTGNYVTYAQNATVTPNVTPTVSGKNVTWSFANNVTEFTFKPSVQTRANSITIVYESSGSQLVAAPTITLNPSDGPYYEGSTVTATISCSTSGASLSYSYDNSNWNSYTQPLAITETTTIYAKATKDGVEAVNSKTITFVPTPSTVANLGAYSELNDDAEFVFTGDVVVAYINSTDTRYVWVKDNTGSALLFFQSGINSVEKEDIIKGGWSGKKSTYNGLHEIINVSEVNVEGSQTVTPAELTLGDITVANQAIYGYLRGVTITAKNNRNFTISDGNTTVAGYNTYNNDASIIVPDANNGKTYDILGIVNVHNNAQFTPVSFTEVQATGPKYYLVGDFNDWTRGDADYEFIKTNGIYVLNNVDFPDNTEFKIVKVENNQTTDYGGNGGGAHYGIHSGHHENISIGGNDNFYIEPGAITNFSFTLNNNAPNLLTVTREAQRFVKGRFSNWDKVARTGGSTDGWTLEQEISANQQFGFVDEWGQCRGCGYNQNMITIEESNLGANLALWTDGKNFNMGIDGNFILNITANKNNLIITRKAETSTAMFDFDNDYASLFPDLDLTTLPYDINEPITATVDGISVTISPKESSSNTTNKIFNSNPKLRVYTGTITVSAPEGYNLTGIDFTNHASNFNLTPSEGEMGGSGGTRTWTGETAILVLTASKNTQISTMNVTIAKANSNAPAAPVIEGLTPFVGSTEVSITCATDGASIHYTTDGTDPTIESTLYQSPFTINQGVTVKARAYSQGGVASTITSKEFVKIPELANLDAFYDYYDSDEFAFTGNLVAIAQTGKYLYAQDNDRGVLIYGDIEPTYQKGDKIPAPFYAKKGSFGDAPQMTNPREMQAATESVTLEPIEITIAQASHENNLYRYAVIKDVTIADEKIVVGDEELELFNRFNIQIDPVEGQLYNVIGVVGWFNGAQFLPLEIVEVNHTYTVAGEPAALFGSETPWDIDNENAEMTPGENGLYTWTSEPTYLDGNVEFKIVQDGSFDTSYPASNYVINAPKPGTYTVTITLNPATGEVNATLNGQVDVYVLGDVNGNNFAPNQGVKMTSEDGKIYTATVTIPDVENGYGFFAFTHKLGTDADDWFTANAYRFLAQSNGNFLVNGATMNVELNMAYNGDNSMKIPAGEYTLTVDMENMKLTITGGTQLSYIIADGVEGVDYTIINDLAVVEKNEPTSELFVSDGNENWIAINAGSNYADLASLKGGFTSGAISGKNQNPVFTLSMAPVEGEDVEPVEPATYSLANEFAPKVNEVIIVSKAYYKASENTLRAYAPGGAQGQSLTVDTSFGDFEFVDGQRYTVQGVINIKEPWNTTTGGKGLKGYDYPFQNYTIKVTDVTEESTPTAINGIFLEEGVKSVRFYNAAGIESNVPFNGLNIVVKEMNDGSRVTTKAIIK